MTPTFHYKYPFIPSKWGCLQNTSSKNNDFWANGEQFSAIKKKFDWASWYNCKILYFTQFWKFLSEVLHVISNYTYQQVSNSNHGSNMAPLIVSRGASEKKNYETYHRRARVQVWTISKNILTISDNFLRLSSSISVYLSLFWTILVGAFWSISIYLDLSWSILT